MARIVIADDDADIRELVLAPLEAARCGHDRRQPDVGEEHLRASVDGHRQAPAIGPDGTPPMLLILSYRSEDTGRSAVLRAVGSQHSPASAVQFAARDILRQLKEIVVEEYGVPADQVSFGDGKVRLPEGSLDYAEIMFRRFGMQGGTLIGEAVHALIVSTAGGVAPERQRELFQEFVQADASTAAQSGGTGLGLVICRRLASLMGGDVRMESAPGRGTTMYLDVRLPIPASLEGKRCLDVGTYDGFLARYNADLANDFGNLVNRTVSMTKRYLEGVRPAPFDGDTPMPERDWARARAWLFRAMNEEEAEALPPPTAV